MNRRTYARLVGLHHVPGNTRTATRTRYARLSSHVPPASDPTTKRRCPHPPQPDRGARTTRDVRPLAKRPQQRVPTAPRGPELCLSYRQTGSSSVPPSPAPLYLYELRKLARVLASCTLPVRVRTTTLPSFAPPRSTITTAHPLAT